LPDFDVLVLNEKGGKFEGFAIIVALKVMPPDDMPARVKHKRTIVHVAPN
jgi:hypothetical protein